MVTRIEGSTLITVDDAGVETRRPLTQPEQDAYNRWRVRQEARSEDVFNRVLIVSKLSEHLQTLNAIAKSEGALTAAQLSNAVRALAKGQRMQLRIELGELDGVD